jgi:hypothetical protein
MLNARGRPDGLTRQPYTLVWPMAPLTVTKPTANMMVPVPQRAFSFGTSTVGPAMAGAASFPGYKRNLPPGPPVPTLKPTCQSAWAEGAGETAATGRRGFPLPASRERRSTRGSHDAAAALSVRDVRSGS